MRHEPRTCRTVGILLTLLLSLGAMSSAHAQPLELRLTARKQVYTLDLGGKTPLEYLRPFSELKLKKEGAIPHDLVGKLPPSPNVDLLLEIRNTGDRAIDIWMGGLYGLPPTLAVEGPGLHRFLCESNLHIAPRPPIGPAQKITIAPGKSFSRPIEQLLDSVSFARMDGNRFYWTNPGEYTAKATWQLADGAEQRGGAVLVSNTVKLRVAPGKISPARLKGLTDAVADIEKGFLKLKEYPLPAPLWYPDYLALLKKECGVDFVGVTFESVMQDAFHPRAEIDGYNGVMEMEIEHRFGAGILARLLERARNAP